MMYDVLIIGGGSAGLTAAIYCVRNGLKVLVFEKTAVGGQIINTPDIENYPALPKTSGYEYAVTLKKQAQDLGVEIKMQNVLSVDLEGPEKHITTKKAEYTGKSVILANGCTPKKIGCPKEDAFIGRGVSYCATCDGNFFRGKDVCVVGGGNTALEDALFLANICRNVYIIHRRDAFRGDLRNEAALREKDNVHFVYDSIVTGIGGESEVTSVMLENVKTKEKSSLDVSGIFVAIGQTPETGLFHEILPLDPNGYITVGEDCKTSIDGVYVAGDIRTKPLRQLVTATADGAVAAVAASEYISLRG